MDPLNPMPVSMLTPLEVPVSKKVLVNILEDVLTNIRSHRPLIESEDDMQELELMVIQRERFLEWLKAQPGTNVPIAMYPLDMNQPPLPQGNTFPTLCA